MSETGDRIRRMITEIRDADSTERAWAAAEGYVNYIVSLESETEATKDLVLKYHGQLLRAKRRLASKHGAMAEGRTIGDWIRKASEK